MQETGGTALYQTVHIAAFGDQRQHRRPLATPGLVVGERQRGLHTGEALDHRRSSIVVERPTCHQCAGEHTDDEPVEHPPQRSGVGAAHVAVAQRPRQRAERVDHLHDVGVVRSVRLDTRHHRLHHLG